MLIHLEQGASGKIQVYRKKVYHRMVCHKKACHKRDLDRIQEYHKMGSHMKEAMGIYN